MHTGTNLFGALLSQYRTAN